jgi:L-lactate dehydrogenase complex protein LldG
VVIENFVEMAKAAGAEVVFCDSEAEAVRSIKKYLGDAGARTILLSAELKERSPVLAAGFPGALDKLPAGEMWADVGVVGADYGVAETGTLVRLDRSDDEKNVWSIPEVCVCFLDRHKIVPSLDAAALAIAGHLARTDLASPQVSLITGPSRTADIENRLTIGVHGPSRLVILLI